MARAPIADIWTEVAAQDVTPPLYPYLLHAWIYLVDSQGELALRVPSAVAAVGLVAAVYWLAMLLAGRAAGLVAALLTALSPLVLQYGQQARTYVWLMLAVTICVAAAVKAHTAAGAGSDRSRVRGWLVLAAVAAAAAVGFHYFAFLVLVPLGAWLVTRPELSQRAKAGFLGAVGAAGLAVFPLWIDQFGPENYAGTERFGRFTGENLVRVIGTPFDGRGGGAGALGAALVVAALVILLRRATVPDPDKRSLVFWLASLGPAALILFVLVGPDLLISRYTAVCAPFMIVALAVAALNERRRVAVVMVGLALLVSVGGLANSHREDNLYPDMGAAMEEVGDGWRQGDVLLVAGYPRQEPTLEYYRRASLPDDAAVARGFDDPILRRARAGGGRLWALIAPPRPAEILEADVKRLGYEPVRSREFPGNEVLQLALATRSPPRD